jgi:Ca2+ transporting ATPase
VHWTIVFNTFVMMQLCNQINARKLQTAHMLRTTWSEWNSFSLMYKNPIFIGIASLEFLGQVIIVQFAGQTFSVTPLSFPQWLFCIGIGCISFPWQLLLDRLIILDDDVFHPTENPE